MKVKMVVQYPSDDTHSGFRALLSMLHGKHSKLTLQIEDDKLRCEWFYFDKLEISDIKFKSQSNGRYDIKYFAMFDIANEEQELALVRLLYVLSQHGDCGHSYIITNLSNGQDIFWDGDGSDRIESINFDNDWKKNVWADDEGHKSDYSHIDHLTWCT